MNKLARGPELPGSLKKTPLDGIQEYWKREWQKKDWGKTKQRKKILRPPLRLGTGGGRVGTHLVA